MENTKYTEEFKQSIVSLYESGKSSTQNTILLSMRLISDSLIILMGFIIVIAFTQLLIFCHPFNLKILYFTLISFRLFVSSLLTMVQNIQRTSFVQIFRSIQIIHTT